MLYNNEGKKHGRSSFSSGSWDPIIEHNRQILREIVKVYLFQKGKLRKTYKEHDVPVVGVAPSGQVMFANAKMLEEKVKLLEEQVGSFYMTRIEVQTGNEYSETEKRAREIVASWK